MHMYVYMWKINLFTVWVNIRQTNSQSIASFFFSEENYRKNQTNVTKYIYIVLATIPCC